MSLFAGLCRSQNRSFDIRQVFAFVSNVDLHMSCITRMASRLLDQTFPYYLLKLLFFLEKTVWTRIINKK